jgi:hypothetical protein
MYNKTKVNSSLTFTTEVHVLPILQRCSVSISLLGLLRQVHHREQNCLCTITVLKIGGCLFQFYDIGGPHNFSIQSSESSGNNAYRYILKMDVAWSSKSSIFIYQDIVIFSLFFKDQLTSQ